MVNMDHRSIKRPRSESFIAEATKKPGKKKKKIKGNKNKDFSDSKNKESTSSTSLESTATAEGLIMTQVLRTLNRTETSRFEAYRRATFSSTAVSDWIAHVLLQNHEHHGQKNGASSSNKLVDLTCPGQAGDITLIVSTLAKAYAQRLVTAALRTCNDAGGPLLPQHVLAAHHARTQAGLDPGFFLSKTNSVGGISSQQNAAALGIGDRDQLLRNAALQAQEDYDKYTNSVESNNKETSEEQQEDEAKMIEEMEITSEDNAESVAILENPPLLNMADSIEPTSKVLESNISTTEDLPDVEMEELVPSKDEHVIIESKPQQPPVDDQHQKVAAAAETKTEEQPMSMEDALLLDMDDDDSSDNDI